MRFKRLVLIMMMVSCSLAVGCGEPWEPLPAEGAEALDAGVHLLSENRLREAREHFSARDDAQARVGEALSRLLLLPEHPGATAVFEVLGAEARQLPMRTDGLYGVDGVCDRMSRGASLSVVEEALQAALPWAGAPIETWEQLEVSVTLEALRPGLLELDGELAVIEALLEAGLAEGAEGFVWPKGLLQSPRSYVLRRSELALGLGAMRALRSVLHASLAYAWPISIREVLGGRDGLGEVLTPEAVVAVWSAAFMRSLEVGSEVHLETSRALATEALRTVRMAVHEGFLEEQSGRYGVLSWQTLGAVGSEELDVLLAELVAAVSGEERVRLSFAEPSVSLSLRAFFAGAIVREQGAPELWRVDEDGAWAWNAAALEPLFIAPHFVPSFIPWSEDSPEFLAASSLRSLSLMAPGEGLMEALSADYNY